jgi:hypothetical protein
MKAMMMMMIVWLITITTNPKEYKGRTEDKGRRKNPQRNLKA